jgi:hypothetical protein
MTANNELEGTWKVAEELPEHFYEDRTKPRKAYQESHLWTDFRTLDLPNVRHFCITTYYTAIRRFVSGTKN